MKAGIRVKVLLAILTLITIIIVSIGVYTMIAQSNILRQNILENTESGTRSFGFFTARAIAAGDDLVISDNLQLLSKNPSYVYGRAVHLGRKELIIGLFGEKYQDKSDKYDERLKLDEKFWKEANSLEQDTIKVVEFSMPGESEKYFSITYPVFRPFVFRNPPRIGLVQVIISDAIIRESIRNNITGLILASVIFWVVGGLGTYFLSSYIVKPLKHSNMTR